MSMLCGMARRRWKRLHVRVGKCGVSFETLCVTSACLLSPASLDLLEPASSIQNQMEEEMERLYCYR